MQSASEVILDALSLRGFFSRHFGFVSVSMAHKIWLEIGPMPAASGTTTTKISWFGSMRRITPGTTLLRFYQRDKSSFGNSIEDKDGCVGCFTPKNFVSDLSACKGVGAIWVETFRGGVGCTLGLAKSCLALNIWVYFWGSFWMKKIFTEGMYYKMWGLGWSLGML